MSATVKSIIKYAIKILPVATALIPTLAFAAPDLGFGQIIKDIMGGLGVLITQAAAYIAYLVGMLASLVLTFGGALLTWAIELNSTVLASPTVKTGFQITLNIANLGFVLAIIVIAFITILRWEKYETKQLIKNLVIAALMINFSLTIAGLFIDFTGVLSNFFIQKATDGKISNFSDSLANAFNVHKLSKLGDPSTVASTLTASFTNFGSDAMKALASVFFAALFTALGAIAMVGTAYMILIRYVYLTILLILMPLAWLSFAFPNLTSLWSRWWNTFIKWVFFMPAATFFLYLAVVLVANQAKDAASAIQVAAQLGTNLPAGQALQGALITENPFATFGQMIAVLGLLVGGLYASQELGIHGAKGFMDAAGSVKKWTTGALKQGVRTPARAIGAPVAGRLANVLSNPKLRWIPGAKGAAAGLASLSSRKGDVEEYQKNYLASLTKDQFKQVALTSPTGPVAKAAILAQATKRGMVGDLTAGLADENQVGNRLELFAKAATSTNPGLIKDLLAVNPKFATKFGRKIEETVRGIRADKASDINEDSLLDKEVAMALSDAQMSSIFRSGSTEQKDNLSKALMDVARIDESTQAAINDTESKVIEVLRTIKEAKERGVGGRTKEIIDLQARLGGLRTTQRSLYTPADDDQRRAFEKMQTLRQRIGNPNIT